MKKGSVIEKIFRLAELDNEPVPGRTLVELQQGNTLLIENHCGLDAYTRENITVRTKEGGVCVNGCELRLCKMTKQQIKICGQIHQVILCRGENNSWKK